MENDQFSGKFYICGEKAEEKSTKIPQHCSNQGETLWFALFLLVGLHNYQFQRSHHYKVKFSVST